METQLSVDLIERSLNFHGQQLQKTWESDRGEGELQKLGLTNLEYSVYQQRQKHLSFQDRGKRLKLHQFIVKKADVLFDPTLNIREEPRTRLTEPGYFAVMPPYESFLSLDKTSRLQHLFRYLKPSDVIISSVTSKGNAGLILKVLCVDGENARSVADLNVKAFCPTNNLISAVDKKNLSRSFLMNDLVCCEVLEITPDAEKIICGMKGVYASEHRARLGLFHSEDFPEAYKLAQEGKNDHYEAMLEKSLGFNNPSNVNCLANIIGLGNGYHTNMAGLKGRFPETEYAAELRQVQAAKWAFRSVADGIDHFKAGRHSEAFQSLNRALSIDPSNIEGLVARGALYANSGSFKKAIEDFECALKVNPNHQNARKYLGETLVAYGRRFEEENKMDEALKAYEGCLAIVPYHEEALNSIEYIKSKQASTNGKVLDGEGTVPVLTPSKAQGVKDTLKQLLGSEEVAKQVGGKQKKKKEKKARRKRQHSSSSSSSSSSGSSSSSSSSSSSDSSSASSQDSHHKKKHKRTTYGPQPRKSETKDRSLSPLSKRMAMMDSGAEVEGVVGQRGSHYNPPAMPFTFSSASQVNVAAAYPPGTIKVDKESEYEQRVCKFLEQTKGDSDYEEKVRKFLDETAKWKKERKAIEEKAKKRRKKEKKAKNKSKKKKKREERRKKKVLKELEEKKLREVLRREKQRRRSSNMEEEEDFLYTDKADLRLLSLGSLPALEDLQSKLSAYYNKVEKGSVQKKKDSSNSIEKVVTSSIKVKQTSPKVMYVHDEEKEEQARLRKLEKKKLDMFAESPPRQQETKINASLPSPTPPVVSSSSSSKFKMQIGSVCNRLKKRDKGEEREKEAWDDVGEKRFIYVHEGGVNNANISSNLNSSSATNSNTVVETKKVIDKKKEIEESLANRPMVLDKLGGFRINPLAADKKMMESPHTSQKRKIRGRSLSISDSSGSEIRMKKKDRSPETSRSRSRSRSLRPRKKYSSESPKKYSTDSRSSSYRKGRSRSKSGSYRSRSRRYRSSESGSYRSRTYSRSRTRSRSLDYHRRSRSRSDDRHHYRNKYQGRYPRSRGTYYRPRFQNFKNSRGGNNNYLPRGRPRGGYINRNRTYVPRVRGRGRPRYFHYKPRDSRDYRRLDRGLSRSDDDDASPMRKVDAAKERIDKLLSEDKRHHTGPLSEGEERDDDYIDRKEYEGKWASKEPEGPRLPPENDIDEMDKFLSQAKSQKKDEMKERNKNYLKPNPW